MNSNSMDTIRSLLHTKEIGSQVNLRTRVHELAAGAEVADNKSDFMALTAIFIAEAWQQEVAPWIREHNGALPVRRIVEGQGLIFTAATDADFEDKKYPEDILAEIEGDINNFLLEKIQNWQHKREQSLSQSVQPDVPGNEVLRNKQFGALMDFIRERNLAGSTTDSPAEHIFNGIGTATNVVLGIAKVIPAVYREAFHPQTISAAEARAIMLESRRMIIIMASMFINTFIKLETMLVRDKQQRQEYDFRQFHLTTTDRQGHPTFALHINKDVLAALKASAFQHDVTTGCPALAINGPSGKNIIEEFYEWVFTILEKHYFPFFDKLKKRS